MTNADEAQVMAFRWVGSAEAYLDQPALAECGNVVIGRYGGRSDAGAQKNEDGALVWCDAAGAWEFAVLLDAHYSAESAELILATLENERERLLAALALPIASAFQTLQETLLAIFSNADFRAQCREVYGEASCLIVARKGPYPWWFVSESASGSTPPSHVKAYRGVCSFSQRWATTWKRRSAWRRSSLLACSSFAAARPATCVNESSIARCCF